MENNKKGKFIVLEGIDGCGKDTQQDLLQKYFVDNNTLDLTKIKFLVNLDLLGTGDDGIMVVNATEFKPQFEKLKKVNENGNYVKEIKQRGKARNSDHYWFSEKGVPCFFI